MTLGVFNSTRDIEASLSAQSAKLHDADVLDLPTR